MSKQVYIDENGNEIQVSGTVNSADMMPMSASDSRKVSEVVANKQDKITVVTTVSGTTDATGNFIVPNISPSTHMLLSAYKDRTLPNTDIAMASIGVNASQTAYLVHLALTDGSPYASKSNVILQIAYIPL